MSAHEPIPFRRRITEQDIVNAADRYDDYGPSILDKFYAREARARRRAALWRGIRNATILLGMALALLAIGWALGFLH